MATKTEPAAAVVAAAPRKTQQRSPNFPSISLPEALKRAKTVYEKDRRNAVSAGVVMEHLGYGKNVSGSAGRVLSALRQYGLLDDTPDDKYRVSDNAYFILTLPDESTKRWEAIGKSATKPAVFKEILKKYVDGLPSDSALREYLIAERAFNPASVDNFIRALKGTIEFAKLYEKSYDAGTGDDPGDTPDDQGTMDTDRNHDQGNRTNPKPPPAGVAREVSSLQEGEAMLQWPATLSPDSVAELEDWLALVVKKLKRRYAPATD